ncbi:unnamed protein product [Orchesella dallaii]|uniref:Calcitonin receptor n=1 Tax=Orchesella dallaii TaxID=48710 RepID=A0ABP1Q617_9HEXA
MNSTMLVENENSTVVLDPSEDEIQISQDEYETIRPYIDERELRELDPKVRLHIIVSALACNLDTGQTGIHKNNFSEERGGYCPRTFDGWSCWNETAAGETANAPCPWFVTGFEPGRIAHKQCLSDGSWFKHPLTNLTWSNYTTCVDLEALQVYQNVNLVYEVGYLVSVCALILSLFIFCRFRSLSCTRVTIHKHLFASFIINNSLWLVWYRTVVNSGITVNELNQVYCAVIHILTHYFMMANYFWMFCEGFYLHTLLVYAFTRAESKLLTWFYVFGWLGPLLPLGLYTTFRGTDADHTERKECWIHDSKWSLLISGPVCICLLVSLAFLINIVRVLVMKLNASRRVTRTVTRNNSSRLINQREGHRRESGADSAGSLRKASRATLILIPLLGLHYFIIPFRPDGESNKWAAMMYEYVAAFTSSLQGLAVSLIFCFCNGEVLAVLKRHVCGRNSTCGGKLLGNLRTRVFRQNNTNSRATRQSIHSCSPTTTVMV